MKCLLVGGQFHGTHLDVRVPPPPATVGLQPVGEPGNTMLYWRQTWEDGTVFYSRDIYPLLTDMPSMIDGVLTAPSR